MAQTTGAENFVAATVELNITGTTFTAYNGTLSAVSVSGGERNTGTAWTADTDTPITRGGKRNPLEITVRFVYSQTSSEFYKVLLTQYATSGGGKCNMRYCPGGSSGDDIFTTNTATGMTILTALPYPSGEVETGEITMIEATWVTPNIVQAAKA